MYNGQGFYIRDHFFLICYYSNDLKTVHNKHNFFTYTLADSFFIISVKLFVGSNRFIC